ncbi:MAG: helix-turn-helix transcriptional regulator [Myxococcales bacterium]|nr:helix-turn-helix transcriptional regulator [Myxococcales bacterium]
MGRGTPAIGAKAALLQVLIRGEGYGLELIDRVREATNGELVLGQGSVYPALRDLEREGMVESYEGPPLPERGGRPRIYYRITAAGQRAALDDRQQVAGLFGFLVPLNGRA